MGVPGFFSWLLRSYKKGKKMIIESLPDDLKVDTLYLDSNCFFHPQCFKVLGSYEGGDNDKLEKLMITRILNYLDFLIDYISPTTTVFISVDGVAPLAKMSQQRSRRFRYGETQQVQAIKERWTGRKAIEWSNTVITPGSVFMEKLHQGICKHLEKRKDKLQYIYSSYHTPGEGEHKILEHIRGRADDSPCVIYGLDADLIFLSLASARGQLFLLREKTHLSGSEKTGDLLGEKDAIIDVEEELWFVSLDSMKQCLVECMAERDVEVEKDQFSNDFIFLCYLLGNDFIPHLPSIEIRTGGLDLLITEYINTYKLLKQPLINEKKQVNCGFLELILKAISEKETYFFTHIQPAHHDKMKKRTAPTSDPCEAEVWAFENLRNEKIIDTVKLGVGSNEQWKFRYYERYFNITGSQTASITTVCQEYFKGLIWIAKYYFEGCPCWRWQYPFSHAPFLSDLYKNFKGDINEQQFMSGLPVAPLTQLLSVIPVNSGHILPPSYYKLMTDPDSSVIDLYPETYRLDMMGKEIRWQCVPMIPMINIERVESAANRIKLTEKENERNTVIPAFVYKPT